jgi:acetaldehyde dehydrogenase/alcohol dehydrogenase
MGTVDDKVIKIHFASEFIFNKYKEKINNLIKALDDLRKILDVPASIKEYGTSEEDFLKAVDTLSEQALDDQCTGANPRYLMISEVKDLYLKAYYGN